MDKAERIKVLTHALWRIRTEIGNAAGRPDPREPKRVLAACYDIANSAINGAEPVQVKSVFLACYCRFPPGTTECDCSESDPAGGK